MPRRYKKRYNRRRKTYKKKSGGMSIADMATAGFNMAKKIVRLINVEKKHYNVGTTQSKSYAGTIIDLLDPAQGQDQDERIGDSIKPLNFKMKGFVYPSATGGVSQFLRLIVFRYKDENGATLTPSDILDSTFVGTSSAVWCNKPWDKRFHSKILYDRVFNVGYDITTTANVSGNLPNTIQFSVNKKLFGHVNWSDSTTTQEGGGLYLLVISNQATDGASPGVQFVSRCVYTDN